MNIPANANYDPNRGGPNYKAMWEGNFAWGIIGLALLLFALAIWAFFASGWYQPGVKAPVDVPAVERTAPVIVPNANERAATPAQPATP
jgi:hypothetical protein